MNKNQHEMSDDELDHLFRESAENLDFDFNPDSWTKMSKKLDEVAILSSSDRGASPWSKRGLFLLIGLLFLIGSYYLIKPSINQSNENTDKIKIKSKIDENNSLSQKYVATNKVGTDNLENTKNNISKPKNSSTNEVNKVTSSVKKSETLTKNNNSFSATQKTNRPNKVILESNINKSNLSKVKSINKSTQALPRRRNSSSNKPTSLDDNLALANSKVIAEKNTISESNHLKIDTKNSVETTLNTAQITNSKPITTVTSTNNNDTFNRLSLNNIALLSPKSTLFKSTYTLPMISFENKEITTAVIPKSQSSSFKKGLYFRFALSPDISLITVDEMTKSGSNWAALLEYRFNKRLSIQTGVIRSMKYYDSYPESYEWPYNWPDPPKLIDINATCKMLDIPLNIRYDITQKPHNRWFVSSGVTSYVMLNEKYVYNYENPTDPKIKWRTWQGKTGTYYAGVLNLSFGYEHQLFRKLSLQAEPFIKIPIAKVGFGKVNLSTVGIFISAKYPIFR